MVNEERRYNIDLNKEKTSRYRLLERIRYEDGTEIIETPDRVVVPKSEDDIFFTVGHDEVGRLDLVSTYYYGTPKFWWAIAYASNIFDPLSVVQGTVLRIPPLTVVYGLKGVFR